MGAPSLAAVARLAFRHPRYLENLLLRKLRFMQRYRWLEDHPSSDADVPPPLVFKVTLTYRCNLRCPMCYEWGDNGWCLKESPQAMKKELSWDVMSKLLAHGDRNHGSYLLIGGEPLLYTKFAEVISMLGKTRRFAITCTNGLLLDRFLDDSAGNPYMTYLISLDGDPETNDKIRGKGVYRRVVENVRRLKELKNPPYIGIQFTLRPENIAGMHAFCEDMEKLGVDWVFFNPSWFITEEQARDYEKFMAENFNVAAKSHLGYVSPFEIDKQEFILQFQKIRSRKWPFQVSCYLEKPEDIYPYVDAPATPISNSFCYKQWLRMDVTPGGEVTPCGLYPDLIVGNLNQADVDAVWNSEAYARFRGVRREKVLPICSKCNCLYLYDAKRGSL
jgi:MoaA/NifB/PqqE/SkfB family radical SAM enzyme